MPRWLPHGSLGRVSVASRAIERYLRLPAALTRTVAVRRDLPVRARDGVILRSEANLVASLGAPWGERARAAARTVLARIAAEEEARITREVRAALDPERPIEAEALADRFGATLPLGADDRELVLRCPAETVFGLIDALLAAGARDVTVRALAYVFRTANPLTERLFNRLGSE